MPGIRDFASGGGRRPDHSPFTGKTGPEIVVELRKQAHAAAGELLSVGKLGGTYPVEHRRRVRLDSLRRLDQIKAMAAEAFTAWASTEAGKARRRYKDDAAGTAAEEARKLRRELQLQRLIATSRAQDAERGAAVIGPSGSKRAVKNPSAYELAAKGEAAYLDGDYEDAQLWAQASTELGGPDVAGRVFALAGEMLETPAQTQARKDLARVQQALVRWDAESSAAEAEVYAKGAAAAALVGDDYRLLAQRATKATLRAKASALSLVETDESSGEALPGSYRQPDGVAAAERALAEIASGREEPTPPSPFFNVT
jgi:hypothetical protein